MPNVHEFMRAAFESAPSTFQDKDAALAFLAEPGSADGKLEKAHALLAAVATRSECERAWDVLVRNRLTETEKALRPLLRTHRDHVIHSAHLYLLGVAIYLQMIRPDPGLAVVIAEGYYRDAQAFYSTSESSYYCHGRLTWPNATLTQIRQLFGGTYTLSEQGPGGRGRDLRNQIFDFSEFGHYFPSDLNDVDLIFQRRWGQAAILHDAAYPLELAVKLLQEYLTGTVSQLGCTVACCDTLFSLELTRLCDLVTIPLVQSICGSSINGNMYTDNSIAMIATNIRHKLHLEYSYETLRYLIRDTFEKKISEGVFDHGVFSALLMLKWINHELRAKLESTPNIESELASGEAVQDSPTRRVTESYAASMIEFFYIECVDAATAVYLHNAKTYVPIFENRELDYRDHPFAWLLFLCDQLQEWCRPSGECPEPTGNPCMESERFEILVVDQLGPDGPKLYFDFPVRAEEIRSIIKKHLRLFGKDFVRVAR